MKDRTTPCMYYVCANHDCQKGVRNVTMSKCKNCQKYHARKSLHTVPVKIKRQKDKDRHETFEY